MKNFVILALLFLIASCSSKPKVMTGPDGTPHILLSCYEVSSCYEEAMKACMGTYKIVNTSSDVSGSEGTTSTTINLLVKCDKMPVSIP